MYIEFECKKSQIFLQFILKTRGLRVTLLTRPFKENHIYVLQVQIWNLPIPKGMTLSFLTNLPSVSRNLYKVISYYLNKQIRDHKYHYLEMFNKFIINLLWHWMSDDNWQYKNLNKDQLIVNCGTGIWLPSMIMKSIMSSLSWKNIIINNLNNIILLQPSRVELVRISEILWIMHYET